MLSGGMLSGGMPPGGMPPRSTRSNGAQAGVSPGSGRLGVPEETCADNPLLAGCEVPPLVPPPATSLGPAPPAAQQRAATRLELVEDALYLRCGSCHGGPPNTGTCDTCLGMYVENVRRLVESGMIVPCNWQGSPLYRRIADGSMPPPDSGQSGLTSRQQGLVGGFVDGMCAELSQSRPDDSLQIEIESWLDSDCSRCHGAAAGDAGGLRGLDGQNDLAELVAAGYLVPCSPEGSVLLEALNDGSMPQPGHELRSAQRRQLEAFIARPCSRR
jgi:hypothetical protein